MVNAGKVKKDVGALNTDNLIAVARQDIADRHIDSGLDEDARPSLHCDIYVLPKTSDWGPDKEHINVDKVRVVGKNTDTCEDTF